MTSAYDSTPSIDFQKVDDDGYTITMTTSGKERGQYICRHSHKQAPVSLQKFLEFFQNSVVYEYPDQDDDTWVSLSARLRKKGVANDIINMIKDFLKND